VKIHLLLAGSYHSCQQTRQVWQEACKQFGLKLISLELEEPEGETLAHELKVNSFPALIVDGKICAVGHPEKEFALDLLSKLKT